MDVSQNSASRRAKASIVSSSPNTLFTSRVFLIWKKKELNGTYANLDL